MRANPNLSAGNTVANEMLQVVQNDTMIGPCVREVDAACIVSLYARDSYTEDQIASIRALAVQSESSLRKMRVSKDCCIRRMA